MDGITQDSEEPVWRHKATKRRNEILLHVILANLMICKKLVIFRLAWSWWPHQAQITDFPMAKSILSPESEKRFWKLSNIYPREYFLMKSWSKEIVFLGVLIVRDGYCGKILISQCTFSQVTYRTARDYGMTSHPYNSIRKAILPSNAVGIIRTVSAWKGLLIWFFTSSSLFLFPRKS